MPLGLGPVQSQVEEGLEGERGAAEMLPGQRPLTGSFFLLSDCLLPEGISSWGTQEAP